MDEFGGHYEGVYYYPGENNKHEFEDLYEEQYEDELVRQFEAGGNYDDDEEEDELQERLYREFKNKEKVLPIDDPEDEDLIGGNHYHEEEHK